MSLTAVERGLAAIPDPAGLSASVLDWAAINTGTGNLAGLARLVLGNRLAWQDHRRGRGGQERGALGFRLGGKGRQERLGLNLGRVGGNGVQSVISLGFAFGGPLDRSRVA